MISSRKRQQAENHYKRIMEILGIDLTNEHHKDTPQRVIKALLEMTSGIDQDDMELPLFKNTGDNLVLVGPIPFSSLCAHHHMPFVGHAVVGYLPNKSITGISKFKRLIDMFAARPQTQEDLTNNIAFFIEKKLKPHAAYVYINSKHTCMTARGVRTPCTSTITHAVACKEGFDPSIKQEFLTLAMEAIRSNRAT